MTGDQDENKKTDKPEEDPLTREQDVRGPIFWAVLIFIPIVFTMVFTLLHDPSEGPPQAVQTPSAAQTTPAPGSFKFSDDGQGARRIMGKVAVAPACVEGQGVGRVFDADMKKQMIIQKKNYRVIRPGDMYTQDEVPGRINFEIDAAGVIRRSWCG